ncbi:uncharacterized protein LOC128674310 [Plodia interpunctella]|uniref:uncharacterized protein LOC128674310 n=1 Tax=Plodia interpunctella TaxID=58824 RepID=UPI0023683CE1|nr:uncharacterized protein LOC128674310 [Plodia interpunctella]
MKLHVLFTLACVLHARAAAVPKLDVSDLQKKLAVVAQEAAKKEILPVDNTPASQELTEQEISVNEVQNSIKKIPVKVFVEDAKPVVNEKLDDIELDDGLNIKRVEIDLKNPGEPQRQEHETQNPEHFEEPASTIKQTVAEAQVNVKQGLQDVSQGIQDWISNNEQINNIQQSIQSLQDNFKEQLNKLNQTVQSFLPQTDNPAVPQTKAFENIDSTLKTLEETFQKTINKMSDGITAYTLFATPSLRQAAETGSTTSGGSSTGGSATGGAATSNNIFLQYLQSLQSTITQGFANVTASIQNTINANGSGNGANNTFAGAGSFINGLGSGIQNIFNPNGQSTTVAGTQSDESASTTARPGWPIWQNIQNSLQNILTPGQNQAGANATQSSSTGPIAQAIQNNPIVQAVGNFIQPNRPGAQTPVTAAPAKPEADTQSADAQPAATNQEGNNAVPAPTEDKNPEDGPIKKIIQNNPIMKGISGAVQKIQNIGNPEKPRDTLEGEDPEQEKGGILLYDKPHGAGHGGHGGPNTGDSNDSNSSGEVAKSEPVKVESNIKADESKESGEGSIYKHPQPAKTE